jgi:hypothetical protein
VSFGTDLLRGLAVLLDEAGVVRYSATDPLPSDAARPACTLLNLPAIPDYVVALTDYPVSADAALSETVTGVQVRIRGGATDPLWSLGVRDGIYDVLQGLRGEFLSTGLYVVHMYWQSETPIGPDGQRRWERTVNYYVHANNAGRNQE